MVSGKTEPVVKSIVLELHVWCQRNKNQLTSPFWMSAIPIGQLWIYIVIQSGPSNKLVSSSRKKYVKNPKLKALLFSAVSRHHELFHHNYRPNNTWKHIKHGWLFRNLLPHRWFPIRGILLSSSVDASRPVLFRTLVFTMNCKMWWYLGIAPKPLSLAQKNPQNSKFQIYPHFNKIFYRLLEIRLEFVHPAKCTRF